jgi:hypothetical protein
MRYVIQGAILYVLEDYAETQGITMPAGRPTTYTKELLKAAKEYLSIYKDSDEVVPTIVGLCRHIGRSKSIVYKWKGEPDKQEFLDILEEIEETQEIDLIGGGLKSTLNPTITKMMLTKHGYSDKLETDITTKGEKITQPRIIIGEKPDKGDG